MQVGQWSDASWVCAGMIQHHPAPCSFRHLSGMPSPKPTPPQFQHLVHDLKCSVCAEYEDICEAAQQSRSISQAAAWALLTRREYRPAAILSTFVPAFMQLTGINGACLAGRLGGSRCACSAEVLWQLQLGGRAVGLGRLRLRHGLGLSGHCLEGTPAVSVTELCPSPPCPAAIMFYVGGWGWV